MKLGTIIACDNEIGQLEVMGITDNSQKVKDGFVFVDIHNNPQYRADAVKNGAIALVVENKANLKNDEDIDTSEIEDVDFINGLIAQFNDLIEAMSKNQKKKFKRIEFVKLTDEQGNPVTDYKIWVVGELYIEDGKPNYYKRRIVRARTMKEAVYKYKKTDSSLTNSLTCFGEKDNTSDYSLGIEIEDIID